MQHGPTLPVYFATVTRMDGLLLGAACAVVARQFRVPPQMVNAMPWFGAACLTAFAAGILFSGDAAAPAFTQTVGWPLLAMGFGALVLYTVLMDSERTPLNTFLRWKPLTRIGKYAYGSSYALIVSLSLIFASLMAALFFNEKLSGVNIVGLVVVLVGIFLVLKR